MPAEETTATFVACAAETGLTDADIAAIVRQSANAHGNAESIQIIVLDAVCRLAEGHGGPCADWVAQAAGRDGGNETAYLRWTKDARAIDWLTSCLTGLCLLFRGHRGPCNRGEDGEP